MKKLFTGLILIMSISAFAQVEDGVYLLDDFRCENTELPAEIKERVHKGMKSSVSSLIINGDNVILTTNDQCGAGRTEYSIDSQGKSTRMSFIKDDYLKWPDQCAFVIREVDNEDLFIGSESDSNTIQVLGTEVDGTPCNDRYVLIFKK